MNPNLSTFNLVRSDTPVSFDKGIDGSLKIVSQEGPLTLGGVIVAIWYLAVLAEDYL